MKKLLYLINEPFDGYQTGYRKAINKLIDEGVLSEVLYYSFLEKFKETKNWSIALNELKELIFSFLPDVILVAHLNKNIPISDRFLIETNDTLNYQPRWIYDERDVFGYFSKPLSKKTLKFSSQCDLVTLCTCGNMMKRFKKAGARNVIYLPQVFDANFGTEWDPTFEREYDIIMIANRARSRIPFRSMPGIKDRERIVIKFAEEFGNKFAVFGKGWDDFPCNKGPINFFDQEKIMRKSRLTIGMDHFYSYEGYYSDRLPISLVSGVPHISYKTPGLKNLFIDGKHLYYYENINQALEIALELLQKPIDELIQFGQFAREYAINHFTESERFRKMMSLCADTYKNKN